MCFGWDVKPDSVRKTGGWAPLSSGNVRIRLEGVGTDAPVTATIYDDEPGQQLDRQVGWPALAAGTELRFSPAVVNYTDDPQGIEVVITHWKLYVRKGTSKVTLP